MTMSFTAGFFKVCLVICLVLITAFSLIMFVSLDRTDLLNLQPSSQPMTKWESEKADIYVVDENSSFICFKGSEETYRCGFFWQAAGFWIEADGEKIYFTYDHCSRRKFSIIADVEDTVYLEKNEEITFKKRSKKLTNEELAPYSQLVLP